MTEEDFDQTQPRLRLSAEPKKSDGAPAAEPVKPASGPDQPPVDGLVAAKPKLKIAESDAPASETTPVPAPEEKKNLQLRRPNAAADGERLTPPKQPLQPAALPETTSSPAELEQPHATHPQTTMPPHRHKSLLISIMMIAVLMLLLGACAYGLYYVLLRPAGAEAAGHGSAAEPADPAAASAATSPKVVSRLSQPIAKAKELVAQMEDPVAAWTEDIPAPLPAPVEQASPQVSSPTSPTSLTVPEPAPEVARQPVTTQQNAVTEFFKQSHIGGVRMGENPKLLLNGLNYGPGDLIDPATGLRFIGLRDKKIVFQDSQGVVYIKSF